MVEQHGGKRFTLDFTTYYLTLLRIYQIFSFLSNIRIENRRNIDIAKFISLFE